MAVNALEKIRKEANKLRKEHPKMKYVDAMKKAGKMYRDGKIRKVKKASNARVASKPKVAAKPVRVASSGVHMGSVKSSIESRINKLERERKMATTKHEKDAIQRQINACHDIIDGIKKLK